MLSEAKHLITVEKQILRCADFVFLLLRGIVCKQLLPALRASVQNDDWGIRDYFADIMYENTYDYIIFL